MRVDIDFWNDSTKETMEELWGILVSHLGMSEEDANEYIEKVYYAAASEYGE
jgi:hypothetical protein